MNSSSHASVYSATHAYPYTSYGVFREQPQSCHPYADYASGLYEDSSSSTERWADEYAGLGPFSDADRALYEAFLTAEVASISPPGPCTVVPMQSPPSYYVECPHPTKAVQLHPELLDFSHPYPYATPSSQTTISPTFEQAFPELTASQPTVACISPDVVCPPVYYGYNHKDDRSTDASPQPSRTSRSSPSAPYPTPSPEPSPRTSTTVFASQRRNAPARTAAPVPSNTWQCPYCPHVQRNRRSPDLKRHIKTHTRNREVADWVCCGVPVLNAIELGVPAATVREAQVFEFDRVLMIGGCRKAFSRRDALKRHLQREKGKCFGNALSLHQPGNRETH
ncbi:hypothetical protein V8D89_002861 [Ganoderma adspersum]